MSSNTYNSFLVQSTILQVVLSPSIIKPRSMISSFMMNRHFTRFNPQIPTKFSAGPFHSKSFVEGGQRICVCGKRKSGQIICNSSQTRNGFLSQKRCVFSSIIPLYILVKMCYLYRHR